MGGGPQTTTSSSAPNPAFMAAYQDLMSKAQGIVGQPLQQYSGPVVAGLSPDQQAAIGTIQDTQGIANPYLNSASDMYARGTQPVGQEAKQYGQDAVALSQDVAEAVWPQAQQAAANANGIATAGATSASGQAQDAASFAQQGALSGAGAANRAASTNVWSQLPTFNRGIQQYMSPYQRQVVDATQAQFNNANAQQQQGIIGNAISSGAWGGDRAGVAQGIAAGQQALAQAPVIAQLENQGFNQATQEFNTQQGLQASLGQNRANLMASTALGSGNLLNQSGIQSGALTSGATLAGAQLGANTQLGASNLLTTTGLGMGQMGVNARLSAGNMSQNADNYSNEFALQGANGIAGLGAEAQNLGLQGAAAQMGAGNIEQGIDQAQLNVPYQQFQQQQGYPYQSLNWLNGIISGLGGLAGGTSSTTQPGPNLFSQLLGAGTTLGSAYMMSDRRTKEGIAPVGKTHDGQTIYRFRYKGSPTMQMGLMADEVEEHHPEAVASNASGILGVDYRKATADSVRRRASGGGVIQDGIPDLSMSFIPSPRNGPTGGGPPKPPTPKSAEDDSASMSKGILSGLAAYKKFSHKDAAPGIGLDLGQYGSGALDTSDIDTALATDMGGIGPSGDADLSFDMPAAFRSGGHIYRRRASGGIVDGDPRFIASAVGGGGVAIPKLAARRSSASGVPANLTKDYGNTASDPNGKSLLPSTSYRPLVAPWTVDPNDDTTDPTLRNLRMISGDMQFRRGGKVRRYAEGGDIYDDPDDEGFAADDDDALGPPPAPSGIAAFDTHPISKQPAGTAMPGTVDDLGVEHASADRGITYTPRKIADHSAEDEKQARLMGLMSAGLGMMAGKSHYFLQNVGAGGQEGLKTYAGQRLQNRQQQEKEAEQADTGAYRATTIQQKAQEISDRLQAEKDKLAQTGAYQTGELDVQRGNQKWREQQATRPHWVPGGINADGDVVMMDANTRSDTPRTYVMKGTKPKPPASQVSSFNPKTIDDLARRGISGENVTTFIGNSPANKAAVLNRMSEIAASENIPPQAITAAVVQLQADKAGARTLAQFQGKVESSVVEADKFADNALKLSQTVNRTHFIPVNVALQAFEKNTGDADVIAFGFANNSLINAYATAIGKGVKTDADTNEAKHLLSIAQTPEQYAAAIRVLKMETHAAQAAPDVVRERMQARIMGRNPFAQTLDTSALGGARSEELPLTADRKVDRSKIDPTKTYRTKLGDKTGQDLLAIP